MKSHYISAACKSRRHKECDGTVPRQEWNQHDHECDCHCHLTMAQRMRLKAMKEIDKRRK